MSAGYIVVETSLHSQRKTDACPEEAPTNLARQEANQIKH